LGILALACVMRSILCNRSYMPDEAYFTPNFFPTCTINISAVHNDDLDSHLSGPAIMSVRSCLSCSGVSLHDAPALSLRICRQDRPLQPVPAGRVWQVRPVKGVSYGITDISSFLMAYAKSLSFALGFLSSLCIQHSRAGSMPLRKPHSAGVFFDLAMQYDRCPVIHAF